MSIQPYTHAMHAAKCRQAAQEGLVLACQPVQIVRRGVVYCACIREPWTTPTGLDCWTVETVAPESCRMTIPVKQVRECGGQDCVCIQARREAPRRQAQRAAALASGSEGVTCL